MRDRYIAVLVRDPVEQPRLPVKIGVAAYDRSTYGLAMRSETRSLTFTERARRSQIVDAAIDVLAEAGYAAASLAAIAERIGVSKGVISYHFAGKDEVLREIMSAVLTEAGDYMRPQVEAASPGTGVLCAYVRSNLDYIDANRKKILAIIEIVNGTPPGGDTPPPYGPGHRRAVEALTQLLVEGQRVGDLGTFSPSYVAVALRASIDAVSELLRTDPSMDVQAYATELMGLFERGTRA